MEWYQVATIVGANLGLFLWAVRQSRKEIRDFHTKLALQHQEFKMRLCAIEERNRK